MLFSCLRVIGKHTGYPGIKKTMKTLTEDFAERSVCEPDKQQLNEVFKFGDARKNFNTL
jgi:hypothetical protein